MKQGMNAELRDWHSLIQVLADYDNFVFSTHMDPDADGLGSQLGLARHLKSLGKNVHILNPSRLRENLDFMMCDGEVEVYDAGQHQDLMEDAQVFIAFDIGHYDRLGALCEYLNESDMLKISIDHHPGEKNQFNYCFNYPEASSTGILIYDLLSILDGTIIENPHIAQPIYAAMVSDTGNFRFNNTDTETLEAASRLIGTGIEPYKVYVSLYEDLNTPGRLEVLSHLLKNIQYACAGRLAWSSIDFEEVSRKGAGEDDLHSLSDFIRSVKGVEIGVAFTRIPGKPVDVSLRSKGQYAVNSVAAVFGGGGHAYAAGCRAEGDLASVSTAVVEECKRVIQEHDGEETG